MREAVIHILPTSESQRESGAMAMLGSPSGEKQVGAISVCPYTGMVHLCKQLLLP